MQNILERLDAGEVVIGDGSYCSTLEKRGYVKVRHQTSYFVTDSPSPGWLLHPGELSGAPGGGGGPGGGVLMGGGRHHPDLHLLQQRRGHARGLQPNSEWDTEIET